MTQYCSNDDSNCAAIPLIKHIDRKCLPTDLDPTTYKQSVSLQEKNMLHSLCLKCATKSTFDFFSSNNTEPVEGKDELFGEVVNRGLGEDQRLML